MQRAGEVQKQGLSKLPNFKSLAGSAMPLVGAAVLNMPRNSSLTKATGNMAKIPGIGTFVKAGLVTAGAIGVAKMYSDYKAANRDSTSFNAHGRADNLSAPVSNVFSSSDRSKEETRDVPASPPPSRESRPVNSKDLENPAVQAALSGIDPNTAKISD
jgi:hypothetical protein